jgi:hypothetical protein
MALSESRVSMARKRTWFGILCAPSPGKGRWSMHLTLLKADGYLVAWVDRQSVRVGKSWEEVFGQLSRIFQDALQNREPITAKFSERFEGREYFAPGPEDVACVRTQLACFSGTLVEELVSAEAPK